MKYDERLIGRKPSDAVLAESKKRLDAMFKKRFEDLQAQRKEQRRIEVASFGVMRDLVKKDPKLTAAVEEGKKSAAARSKIRAKPPQRKKVEGRQHIGSVAVTLVPPFWTWQWNAQTGPDATGTTSVDPGVGMSFDAYTGDNGKTASTAVAVGGYFQPTSGQWYFERFCQSERELRRGDVDRVRQRSCWQLHRHLRRPVHATG